MVENGARSGLNSQGPTSGTNIETVTVEAPPGDTVACPVGPLLISMLEEQYANMMGTISPIADELTLLRQEFAKRLSYDATKEDAFSRLYRELEDYRTDQPLQRLRPIYLDLILLSDRIEQNYLPLQVANAEDEKIASILRSLHDEILEVLFRGEVEPLLQVSSRFDPTTQHAVGVEQTEEEQEHYRVARVVRRGFKYRDRILRAEEVVIKKFV